MRLLCLALALSACTSESTLPEYLAARTAALAPPPPLVKEWSPDASLHLSKVLVTELVTTALGRYNTLDQPVSLDNGAVLRPDLKVTNVNLHSGASCPTCIDVELVMDGHAAYEFSGIKIRGPLKVTSKATLDVSAREIAGGEWVVELTVKTVDSVSVRSQRLPQSITTALDEPLTKAARGKLAEYAEPQTIARFTPQALPLLAVRAGATNDGIRVDMRTYANSPTPLGAVPNKLRAGWQFSVQTDSLLDLARKRSFEHGVVAWDVVADPTGLRIGRGTFEMDLRLYKTTGAGWWRDYLVKGTIDMKDSGFSLMTTGVEKTGMSPGATTADPLAALGEAQIIENITAGFDATIPASHGGVASGMRADATVESIYGTADMVQIRGDLSLKQVKQVEQVKQAKGRRAPPPK
ncbi:MAG: hypothetical protein ACI9MC_001056 [Kiritimatiellia bacterium]